MMNNTYTKSFAFPLVPGAKAANTIFKVLSVTQQVVKPQSPGYQADALTHTPSASFQSFNAFVTVFIMLS